MARAIEEELSGLGGQLLGYPVGIEYRQGWARGVSLQDALAQSRGRDREAGITQVGPHRGDLRLVVDERAARRLVSRGHQKLLASALVLAAANLVKGVLGHPLLLLLDDPSAELDSESLGRLLVAVCKHGGQVVATALTEDDALFPEPPVLFHVEQGIVRKCV
jgi:DNA replication and repair protein RecF